LNEWSALINIKSSQSRSLKCNSAASDAKLYVHPKLVFAMGLESKLLQYVPSIIQPDGVNASSSRSKMEIIRKKLLFEIYQLV